VSVESVRARLDAATSGPWAMRAHDGCATVIAPSLTMPWDTVVYADDSGHPRTSESDADLIAHAPTDLRLALDVIEAATEVRQGFLDGHFDMSKMFATLDAFEAAP